MAGLREIAEGDLGLTLEDDVNGFGWAILVTDPTGKEEPLVGQSGDIGQTIDANTGLPVSGRLAHVSLRVSSLQAAFSALPVATPGTGKPWRFTFNDLGDTPYTFAVQERMTDRTLGMVTYLVEAYKA